ncbi:MAG: diguanylate cyclase [Chloroflexi bacterium]|nr:MAG: diguanylate cyclase [Chloroflexota bacterium]
MPSICSPSSCWISTASSSTTTATATRSATRSSPRSPRRSGRRCASTTCRPGTAATSSRSSFPTPTPRIHLSIGIATFPRPAGDAASLVETADAAMYRAKQSGGGIRVWEHSLGDGPRGAIRSRTVNIPPAPYLADPARLATVDLQMSIPIGLASEWNAVVVGRDGQVLTVALPQPNPAAVDAISKATGFAVYPVFSNPADLEATRRRLSVPSGK